MKIYIYLIIIVIYSCGSSGSTPEIPGPLPDLSEIEEIMKRQEDSWNKGDIASFMNGYWNSDSLLFIGSRGLSKGYESTLGNYLKSYPDSSAMGMLVFDNSEVIRLESHHALVIGSWTLYRASDTLGGMYSLTWRWNQARGWEIIADHSS